MCANRPRKRNATQTGKRTNRAQQQPVCIFFVRFFLSFLFRSSELACNLKPSNTFLIFHSKVLLTNISIDAAIRQSSLGAIFNRLLNISHVAVDSSDGNEPIFSELEPDPSLETSSSSFYRAEPVLHNNLTWTKDIFIKT